MMRKGKRKPLLFGLIGLLAFSFIIPTVAASWVATYKVPGEATSNSTATSTTPVAYFNNRYFSSVENAVIAANNTGSTQTVYVIPGTSTTIKNTNVVINSGITLCLPFQNKEWDPGRPTATGASFVDGTDDGVNTYRKIHLILENSSITINAGGYLYIGGKFVAKGASGYYTQISLDKNSHISVSGTLINYGYIKETDGLNPYQSKFKDVVDKYNNEIDSNRYIEVLNGGIFRLSIGAYSDMSASYLEGLNSKKICPMDVFDFPNTQTYLKINAGGILEAQAKLYVTSSHGNKDVDSTVMVVCNSAYSNSHNVDPLFYLEEGSLSIENCPTDVNLSNSNSKTVINLNGTIEMGYLYIDLDVIKLNTSDMYLPLSYKFNVRFGSTSIFSSNYKIKFLGGAHLYVEKGADVHFNSSTIFYESGDLADISTTYPADPGDATIINNGTITFGSSATFGGHISTTATDDSAKVITSNVSITNLTAVSTEGNTQVQIRKNTTGDFYNGGTGKSEVRLLDGGQIITSRGDGKCWANGSVSNTFTLTILVTNPNSYSLPAAGFKAYSYNSSGGGETQISAGDYETEVGEYTYILEKNQQFKVHSLDRNLSSQFTYQEGSSYTFTSNTKYTVNGNIVLTITAAEGVKVRFKSEGTSGNSGSSKSIAECSTSNGQFVTIATGGNKGADMDVILRKNFYFKYTYTPGLGSASWDTYHIYDGIISSPSKTEGTNIGGSKASVIGAGTSNAYKITKNSTVYIFKADSGGGGGGGCVLPETLVTMADGSYKMAKDIVQGDLIRVFNHETGMIDVAPVTFNDFEPAAYVTVINLNFSNGHTVGVISEHGFFDLDTMRYEYITEDNYSNFIGHKFYVDGGSSATLDSVTLEERYTEVYSPTSFYHLDLFVEDMLSMPGGISGLFNIFEYDSNLQYEQTAYQNDIETYGLFTYEDLAPLGVTEIMFEAYAGQYLKVALGKGILTMEYLEYLIERYGHFTD